MANYTMVDIKFTQSEEQPLGQNVPFSFVSITLFLSFHSVRYTKYTNAQ